MITVITRCKNVIALFGKHEAKPVINVKRCVFNIRQRFASSEVFRVHQVVVEISSAC